MTPVGPAKNISKKVAYFSTPFLRARIVHDNVAFHHDFTIKTPQKTRTFSKTPFKKAP
jgi:hypothetical protein